MATGCTCGTAGCGGVAHEPGGKCPGCQTAALPAGPARTLREILQPALYGRDIGADITGSSRSASREAGS
jgi:hypothetical protein